MGSNNLSKLTQLRDAAQPKDYAVETCEAGTAACAPLQPNALSRTWRQPSPMTTYASEVHLDPYQAEVFLRTLKAYVAQTGCSHLGAITRDVEEQMPGPMRLSGWPHYFSQPCEWAFELAGRSAANSQLIEQLLS